MKQIRDQPGVSLLIDAVWRGDAHDATNTELQCALALARSNHVEGQLARAYPRRLPHVLAEVRPPTRCTPATCSR